MKKILAVFGTRPDAIKMCPLVNELKKREGVRIAVCVSGQHRQMLDGVLSAFSVVPDYDLSVMKPGQDLFDITEKVTEGVRVILEKEKPDILLVHGDTTTALAAAMAGFYMKIPVAHVEAGLRTYNIDSPYPEEFNRRAISLISSLDFAPTRSARYALINEGKRPDSVFVTGNTVLDALCEMVKRDYSCPELDWAGEGRLVLMTTHRRENLGEPMRNIFRAVRRVAEEFEDVKIIYPVHLNPQIGAVAREMLGDHRNIKLTEPIGVADFHNILSRSHLVLTDSGGIQEEAAALGKPTLILREQSERREELLSGSVKLIGTDEESVFRGISRLLRSQKDYEAMLRPSDLCGGASRMIADILCE